MWLDLGRWAHGLIIRGFVFRVQVVALVVQTACDETLGFVLSFVLQVNCKLGMITHRLISSSFLGLPYRILNMNHKKELLRSLWVSTWNLRVVPPTWKPSTLHPKVIRDPGLV